MLTILVETQGFLMLTIQWKPQGFPNADNFSGNTRILNADYFSGNTRIPSADYFSGNTRIPSADYFSGNLKDSQMLTILVETTSILNADYFGTAIGQQYLVVVFF